MPSNLDDRSVTTTPKYLGVQHQDAISELDVVKTPAPGVRVALDCTEFTSHCPVTKQPDFARIEIEYVAEDHIVETKSLKLWLWSWRNVARFNEAIVVDMARKFLVQVRPREVTVRGHFHPRGGIAVNPTFTIRSDDAQAVRDAEMHVARGDA